MDRQKEEKNQKRRQKALESARACADLLYNHFGVRKVIPFGSLVGQGPWHDKSDIDLAVEGLASADFFPAYSACRNLLPEDMELDLVSLENVPPQMQSRILGEINIPDKLIPVLKSLVEDELTALKRVTQEMEDLLSECQHQPSRTELRAMASMLHEFYNGVESILKRIAVWLSEEMPQGENWHTELLNQMANEQEEIRPSLIDAKLHARLRDYLDFRHFFRHAYGYSLEWSKMQLLVEGLAKTLDMLQKQIENFFVHLEE